MRFCKLPHMHSELKIFSLQNKHFVVIYDILSKTISVYANFISVSKYMLCIFLLQLYIPYLHIKNKLQRLGKLYPKLYLENSIIIKFYQWYNGLQWFS